jgi:hypothetical protein
MPELQGIMTYICNSRESWFAERQGLEIVARDLGDANLFFTLNCDPRAWSDVRRLLYELNEGAGKEMPPDYYEYDMEKFMRFATQVSVFLNKKSKLFIEAFLGDICRIPKNENRKDETHPVERTEHSWYWYRTEFTQIRGTAHFHCLAKLPHVLDTAILSRMVQNMRVVREEIKYKNITQYEKACTIIRCGLLASQYLVLFANSVSTCSFFSEDIDNDHYDESKVIDLDAIRAEYVENYLKKDVNRKTHPIMRRFDDVRCDENKNVEMARVAAVSCMHHCIQKVCGGDEKTSKGCRFDFPKKSVKYTVSVLMEVHENQMELQMLMRRTNDRIPNLQRYFLKYYRANHDFTVLADVAHKMRYASKYASKSGQISVLLNEVIEYLQQKSTSVLPPNVKQAMTQLLLADCAHRSYMTKQELAYRVLNLPIVRRNFSQVKTIAHYPRAVVIEDAPNTESGVIELTDRTEYAAYSERCWEGTETKGNLTKQELVEMNLREFAETVNFKWVMDKTESKLHSKDMSTSHSDAEQGDNETECELSGNDCDDVPLPDDVTDSVDSGKNCHVKWRCRDRRSGHWLMWRKRKPVHIRSSTLLYTDLARNYVSSEDAKHFFDLQTDKRNQLKRAYQEMVCYLPWQDDPDNTFLSKEVLEELSADGSNPDAGSRYSLRRLEEYLKVYMRMWHEGIVAQPGTQWHRDNQYSYTMYLATHSNTSQSSDS